MKEIHLTNRIVYVGGGNVGTGKNTFDFDFQNLPSPVSYVRIKYISVYESAGATNTLILVRCPNLFGAYPILSFPVSKFFSEIDLKIPINRAIEGTFTFELLDGAANPPSLIADTTGLVISFGLEFVKEN
jgi:hypothetical protein